MIIINTQCTKIANESYKIDLNLVKQQNIRRKMIIYENETFLHKNLTTSVLEVSENRPKMADFDPNQASLNFSSKMYELVD